MNKKLLIGAVLSASALGLTSLVVGSETMTQVYVAASASFLGAAAIGGLISYNTQEMRDFREVHREKSRMQMQKIELLQEQLIEKEKEILLLNARLQGQEQQGTGGAGEEVVVLVGSGAKK